MVYTSNRRKHLRGINLLSSLAAYWELSETSGNAIDLYSTNDLTDTNTVTAGTMTNVGNCRVFTRANNEYFTIADNTEVSVGDIDFCVGCWANFASTPASQVHLMTHWDADSAGTVKSWFLRLGNTQVFEFRVSADGSTASTLLTTSPTTYTTSTNYFVLAWHDATANTLNMQINNGSVFSTAHSTGVFNTTTPFRIGALGGSTLLPMDGQIRGAFLLKKVPTATERSWLFNSGNGRPFSAWM